MNTPTRTIRDISTMALALPNALLLDLDDTIIDDTGSVQACWQEACDAYARECDTEPSILLASINRQSSWFWSDPDRHRCGRLDLRPARIQVARIALEALGIDNKKVAQKIGDAYHHRRLENVAIFPDAVETLHWFREHGCKLALLTNGAGAAQRSKIARFNLEGYFDAILIEGEIGFGKPDLRVYKKALDAVGVDSSQAWMVGDNLEWDVATPQRLGIFSVWVDRTGKGHRNPSSVTPDRIVRTLSDLRNPAAVPRL